MKVEVKVPEHTIITANDQGVTIDRKGLRNLANRGQLGSTLIPYWAIASVTFHKSHMFGGKLELNTIGGQQHNGGIGGLDPTTAFTAYGKATAVPFRNGKNKEMKQLCDFIQNKINEAHKPQTAAKATDPADEIAKYKKLADDGTISQEEFKAKKKQLLGL